MVMLGWCVTGKKDVKEEKIRYRSERKEKKQKEVVGFVLGV